MRDALAEAIRGACARIAPTWPLDRFIAVNPFWEMIDRPVAEVAALLAARSGAQLLMPRGWYRQAYREGRLRDHHLRAALDPTGSALSFERLRALLDEAEPAVPTRVRVVDVADASRDLARQASWRAHVTQAISQFCAAYFDDGQARLGPDRSGGLYASWRRHAETDRSGELLMDAPGLRDHAQALPATAPELIERALAVLDVATRERESYLWSLLLDQNGWASWCAYRRWTARLAGGDDATIVDLLAIRLAWEWLVYRAGGDAVARRWATSMASWPSVDAAAEMARADDWLLQSAMEIAGREDLVSGLPAGCAQPRPSAPAVQAVFCIDVRSEVMRRGLERASSSIQTLGFAGFFGLPLEYQPLGVDRAHPQVPGLLAPRLRAAETASTDEAELRARAIRGAASWRAFKTDALSTFTFVEAMGLTYAGALLADSLGLSRAREAPHEPRIVGSAHGSPLAPEERWSLAAGMLRGMSLTRDFARLVVLAGHGSSTRNNPHAAGLDCGACGGQTGEVNARAAAALLNDPDVRAGLAAIGIAVPATTWFVAALHDTTTDEVSLLEVEHVPASHQADLAAVRPWLAEAGIHARAERAGSLGLSAADAPALERAVRARSRDWAQVRPEWGLANNAAFIAAPREHCRHLNLGGRVFLHEYRHREDEGYAILELIMTAPMVVAHWINFQYYASTVDNERYGSGNKVLHNVVGGHIGVFEGNAGDLRIGLPMQSLHDGERWVHTPLRLSVFLEAPRAAIDAVLATHAHVRSLVANGWISLFQLDEDERAVYAHRTGGWHRAQGSTPTSFQASNSRARGSSSMTSP